MFHVYLIGKRMMDYVRLAMGLYIRRGKKILVMWPFLICLCLAREGAADSDDRLFAALVQYSMKSWPCTGTSHHAGSGKEAGRPRSLAAFGTYK